MRLLYGLLFALLVAGCSLTSVDTPEFGDGYEVVANGEDAPRIVDGELAVTVRYGGGCADHTFELRHRTTEDGAELWLVHDANGDTCEAYITDPLRLAVPEAVIAAQSIVLLVEDGSPVAVRR